MKIVANIIVSLKDNVRDTKGEAISTVINRTINENPDCIEASVLVGKYFKLTLEGENEHILKEKIDIICKDVFSNPVLEKYEIISMEKI